MIPGLAWRQRWLLWSFTRREVTDRYTGSAAGAAWALAHPLALLAIYGFVFTTVFRVKLPADVTQASYLAFVAVTLWPWLMFGEALSKGAGAVQAGGALIRKVAFPHRFLVYASVFATFAVQGVGYLLVLGALAAMGEPVRLAGLPAAAFLVACLLVGTVGLTLFFAALQVMLRDVAQFLNVAIMLVFYATPVLYPVTLVPASLRPWIEANPFSHVAERLREVLLAGSGLRAGDLAILAGAVAIFAVGTWVFERLSPFFEDFL